MDKFYIASTLPISEGTNSLATALDIKLEYALIADLKKFIATLDTDRYNYERDILSYFTESENASRALYALENNLLYWCEVDEVYAFGSSPEHAFASLSDYLMKKDLLPND